MSNAILTEARFIELLEAALDKALGTNLEPELETKLENPLEPELETKLDKTLQTINDTLKRLEGFHKYKIGAIEYELISVLKMYLALQYPLLQIAAFPLKSFNDPYTGKLIADLDAAFLLSPLHYAPDYDRLCEAGVPYPHQNKSSIFVLVEANPYIDRGNIATKLWQFDKIHTAFALAKRMSNAQTPETVGLTKEFIRTVERNAFLADIDECLLFFGAVFWEKGLMKQLQSAVKKRNNLAGKFRLAPEADKVKIYHTIRAIERKWYRNSDYPERVLVDLSPEQIVMLDSVDGAMGYVRIIQPSGDSYSIQTDHEAAGIPKTRRKIVGNPEENGIP